MNKKAVIRLTEFLESEVSDYGLAYNYEWDEDYEAFGVCIFRNETIEDDKQEIEVLIKYNEEKDDLSISMDEDYYETIREFDHTVRYFWMLVAPAVFKSKGE